MGQSTSNKSSKHVVKEEKLPEFKNNAEQEEYFVKKLFKEEYKKQSFQKFSGKIDLFNKNTYRFNTLTLEVSYTPVELRTIFSLGLLYPTLMGGEDSLKITDLQELKYLESTPTYKRFSFWLFRPWLANPQVYYIELTNESATKETDLIRFIRGAKLTFLRAGGIII